MLTFVSNLSPCRLWSLFPSFPWVSALTEHREWWGAGQPQSLSDTNWQSNKVWVSWLQACHMLHTCVISTTPTCFLTPLHVSHVVTKLTNWTHPGTFINKLAVASLKTHTLGWGCSSAVEYTTRVPEVLSSLLALRTKQTRCYLFMITKCMLQIGDHKNKNKKTEIKSHP
jgi:hypothetical protein